MALMDVNLDAQTSQAVLDFVSRDLLDQDAGARQTEAGRTPDPDLRLRTLLHRAARQLDARAVPNKEAELRMRAILASGYEAVGDEAQAKAQQTKVLDLARGLIEPARGLLERSRETLGARHPVTIRASLTLSDLCRRLKNYEEAEQLLMACYRQLETPVSSTVPVDGDLHEYLEVFDYDEQHAETVQGLARLYDAWGKKPKAAEWRQRVQKPQAGAVPPLMP
jgi:hypothetical protein